MIKKYINKKFLIKHYIELTESIIKIAKEQKCSETLIHNRLIKFGINCRNRSLTSSLTGKRINLDKKWLIKKYQKEKLSSRQIAKILKCSTFVILKYLKKFNIKTRTLSESVTLSYKTYKYLKELRKKQLTGANHWNFQGIMKADKRCIICNNKIGYASWRTGSKKCKKCFGITKKRPLKYCRECKTEISRKAIFCKKCCVGKNRFSYIDGRSFEKYPQEFNYKLKKSIRKRDNYECQNCGMTEEEHLIVIGKVLHIHHINYDKMNCSKENLISVCQPCNSRANVNRDYWQEFYIDKIN